MIIHTPTQELYNKTLKKLIASGFKWASGSNRIEENRWVKYGERTRIDTVNGYYGHDGNFNDEKIVEASDYLGEPKFKVGDKVKIKQDCSRCIAGEICTLKRGEIDGKTLNDIYARNERVEKLGSSGCSCENNWELVEEEKQEPVEPLRPEPRFQVGQVLKYTPKIDLENSQEVFVVMEIKWFDRQGKKRPAQWYYAEDTTDYYGEESCELYCGEPLNIWNEGKERWEEREKQMMDEILFMSTPTGRSPFYDEWEQSKTIKGLAQYYNANFDETIINNKPKKTIMNTIVDFAKNLTLPVDEKLLRKVGIKNNEGNYTEAAREIVVNFEAVALGYKDEQDLFTKIGYSNNLSSFEYASLLKKYEDKLIEVAKQMEAEDKKK